MNEYIIDYKYKGEHMTAYVHAYSFEDARARLEQIKQTASINWVLEERIPVADEHASEFMEAYEEMRATIRKMRNKEQGENEDDK